MLHLLKRFVQRVAIKLIRITNLEKQEILHSEYGAESFAICKTLINRRDTTLLISPISGKRYIKSDDSELFIIVEQETLTIVNHQYSYNINIKGKAQERIAKMFDIEVEARRNVMESEIRANIKHSLSNIYENLVNEQV